MIGIIVEIPNPHHVPVGRYRLSPATARDSWHEPTAPVPAKHIAPGLQHAGLMAR